MKKFTKLLGIVLIIALVMSISVSAFAASIQITKDASYDGTTNRTYSAYKIFDASYDTLSGSNTQAAKDTFTYTPDGAAVAYTMDASNPWVDVMKLSTQTWFNVDEDANGNYVITPAGTDGASYSTVDHAKAFAAFLQTNKPASVTADYTVTAGGDAVTVTDEGYYLLIADDGSTNLALVTTDVTMVEKNTYLTTTKTTSETSYSVGDTVTYTATVNIPADTKITPTTGATDADYVIVHDTMDSKLAFAKDVAATVDSAAFADFTASYDETNGWTPSDDCTFELKIPVTNALLGKTITFTYTAEVTSAATDPDSGLVNTLFGEKNGYKTTPDTVEVWTFDFDLVKVFDDASDNTLTATFELRTDADDESTAIALISKTGGYIKADSDDEDAETEAKETVTQFTATNGEALNFQGFKAGKYYLVEIETSTGYNLLDGPVEITITDTTTTKEGVRTISHTVSPVNALDQVEVQNHSGTVLPSTGGIGTTIFYVVGSILVVAAGVLLITKKRMSREG